MLPFPLERDALIRRFNAPFVSAIVLMGSQARGEAGPYSDVDIVRYTNGTGQSEARSYLLDGHLVIVSDVSPQKVENCFVDPVAATGTIPGFRSAEILLDHGGYFAAIQERARAFQWDAAMQERANQWASAQMVGWIEEVHKGLAGLQQNNTGRLLNARFGLSWGLNRVIQVQRGVLTAGDNEFYDAVAQVMGAQSEWVDLRRRAFGMENQQGETPTLADQVRAGLRLYVLTAQILEPILRPEDQPLIAHTVELIQGGLST